MELQPRWWNYDDDNTANSVLRLRDGLPVITMLQGFGKKCYQKDKYWAACLSHCSPGQVRLEDAPQWRTPWSCDVLR